MARYDRVELLSPGSPRHLDVIARRFTGLGLMETLVDRLMASGNATQLTAGADGFPKTTVGADFLFASADTLAGHAQGAAHDGATEELNQDHSSQLVSDGQRDHA